MRADELCCSDSEGNATRVVDRPPFLYSPSSSGAARVRKRPDARTKRDTKSGSILYGPICAALGLGLLFSITQGNPTSLIVVSFLGIFQSFSIIFISHLPVRRLVSPRRRLRGNRSAEEDKRDNVRTRAHENLSRCLGHCSRPRPKRSAAIQISSTNSNLSLIARPSLKDLTERSFAVRSICGSDVRPITPCLRLLESYDLN